RMTVARLSTGRAKDLEAHLGFDFRILRPCRKTGARDELPDASLEPLVALAFGVHVDDLARAFDGELHMHRPRRVGVACEELLGALVGVFGPQAEAVADLVRQKSLFELHDQRLR